jgi:hypothetical protein
VLSQSWLILDYALHVALLIVTGSGVSLAAFAAPPGAVVKMLTGGRASARLQWRAAPAAAKLPTKLKGTGAALCFVHAQSPREPSVAQYLDDKAV